MEFPYKIRDSQRVMIKDIESVLDSGMHIVLEAPTGFGKTATSLYPTIKFALKHGKKVLYLVRTNSQEQKVIEESKKMGVLAIGLQGRGHMCPLSITRAELKNGNAEELSLYCKKVKDDVKSGDVDACPFYYNYINNGDAIRKFEEEVHTSEEVLSKSIECGVCAYEAIKDTLKKATVVAMPYVYFLFPLLRNTIFDRMDVSFRDIVLIVDEAHNFPDFARELRSDELSEHSLDMMEKECLEYGNREIFGVQCADLAEFVKEAIFRMQKYADGDEAIVPHYSFEEELGAMMKISPNKIGQIAMELLKYGMAIREEQLNRRKLPRSYVFHAGNFLLNWKDTYSYDYLHIAKFGENPLLEIFCLDPSEITDIINSVYASVHMSGTLNLKVYRDLIGLPRDTMLKKYESPFPKEHLKILYVDDVTTKYDEVENNLPKIAKYITEIVKIGKNTAVFFPSYSILERVAKQVLFPHISEKKDMHQRELYEKVEKFRKFGGVIFSVFSGRVAEGLDFPGKQLEIVIIAGIPYPKPTARKKMLQKYFDLKFGRGWDYAYKVPATIKMKQAIGRLIRGENDRGVAIILDKRAKYFTNEIPAKKSESITEEVAEFFESSKEKGEEGRHRDE